jgi:hypothetical protein
MGDHNAAALLDYLIGLGVGGWGRETKQTHTN